MALSWSGPTRFDNKKIVADSQTAGGSLEFAVPDGYVDWAFNAGKHFLPDCTAETVDPSKMVPEMDPVRNVPLIGQRLPDDAIQVRRTATPLPPVLKPDDVKPSVLVGVIDEGLAFAHERFRTENHGSRIAFAWLQDAQAGCEFTGVSYGRELSKHGFDPGGGADPVGSIDGLLAQHTRDGLLNERAFYRDAGLIDFRRLGHKAAALRVSHGTHMMDLASGFSPSEDRTDRPIICVDLPTATVADTSGIGLDKYLLDAIGYILTRADEIAKEKGRFPVVINFSSGIRGGPHDGSSTFERILDRIIDERRCDRGGIPTAGPVDVVLPAGNSHLAQGATDIVLQPAGCSGNERTVSWRVQPDDRTVTFLELWAQLPIDQAAVDAGNVALTVQPPGASDPSPLLTSADDGCAIEGAASSGGVVCKAYFERMSRKGLPPTDGQKETKYQRGRFLIALAPTAFHDAPAALAPAGVWKIGLRSSFRERPIEVQGWIQWDDRPVGYSRRGRQSYFEDPAYERFQKPSGHLSELDTDGSYIKRSRAMNGLATGRHTTVVGGFRGSSGLPAPYSCAGRSLAGPGTVSYERSDCDGLALCEDSHVSQGVPAAGSACGSYVTLNGTSVAAPQVTRFIADARAQVGGAAITGRDLLAAKAGEDDGKIPTPPPKQRRERRASGPEVIPVIRSSQKRPRRRKQGPAKP